MQPLLIIIDIVSNRHNRYRDNNEIHKNMIWIKRNLYINAKRITMTRKMITQTMIIINAWSKNCFILKNSTMMKSWYQHQHNNLISTTFPKKNDIKQSFWYVKFTRWVLGREKKFTSGYYCNTWRELRSLRIWKRGWRKMSKYQSSLQTNKAVNWWNGVEERNPRSISYKVCSAYIIISYFLDRLLPFDTENIYNEIIDIIIQKVHCREREVTQVYYKLVEKQNIRLTRPGGLPAKNKQPKSFELRSSRARSIAVS